MNALPVEYDLVVVGGNAGGLTVAISLRRAGLQSVRIIEGSHTVAFPELVGPDELDVGYGETVQSIDTSDERLRVTTNKRTYVTNACLVSQRHLQPDWEPSTSTYRGVQIHIDSLPETVARTDLLIVGNSDHAVELTVQAAAAGGRVVLAAPGLDTFRLSSAGALMLRRLELQRRATLLLHSPLEQIVERDGFPMAYFDDRRTPDLQFDNVVFASQRRTATPADVGATESAIESGRLWFQGMESESGVKTTARGWEIPEVLTTQVFPELHPRSLVPATAVDPDLVEDLRAEHYNATITHFEPAHSDLWVLRVQPDSGTHNFEAGQYASLGLGYWEERIDEAIEPDIDDRWGKLVRRSYSISSRIFDDLGYLADENKTDELEFYIVLVPADGKRVPGLTPRLALKRPGDRIYLGPKVAGRYTLGHVTDPAGTVVFLATGTGEAPHNAMINELLRKGHYGPIVSVVTVRNWADLGYREEHEQLAQRYGNYRYVAMPTREDDVPKRYVQDLLRPDVFEPLGKALDPETTHVYMCGNPSMIGLPEDGRWPQPEGAVEILTSRGFRLDERKNPGNLHVEEYW